MYIFLCINIKLFFQRNGLAQKQSPTTIDGKSPTVDLTNDERFQSHLQLQISQISATPDSPNVMRINNEPNIQWYHENQVKFQRPLADGDFEFVSNLNIVILNKSIYFTKNTNSWMSKITYIYVLCNQYFTLTFYFQLKFLSYEELQQRMANLDAEMEREIDELRRRYQTKRQPIIDALNTKRRRQQNF